MPEVNTKEEREGTRRRGETEERGRAWGENWSDESGILFRSNEVEWKRRKVRSTKRICLIHVRKYRPTHLLGYKWYPRITKRFSWAYPLEGFQKIAKRPPTLYTATTCRWQQVLIDDKCHLFQNTDRFVKRAKRKFKLIIIYFQSLMYRSDYQTVSVVRVG